MLEGRGLDVTPKTIEKFRSGGDEQTAVLLEDILKVVTFSISLPPPSFFLWTFFVTIFSHNTKDEITHVTAGQTWFTYLCEHSDPPKV